MDWSISLKKKKFFLKRQNENNEIKKKKNWKWNSKSSINHQSINQFKTILISFFYLQICWFPFIILEEGSLWRFCSVFGDVSPAGADADNLDIYLRDIFVIVFWKLRIEPKKKKICLFQNSFSTHDESIFKILKKNDWWIVVVCFLFFSHKCMHDQQRDDCVIQKKKNCFFTFRNWFVRSSIQTTFCSLPWENKKDRWMLLVCFPQRKSVQPMQILFLYWIHIIVHVCVWKRKR